MADEIIEGDWDDLVARNDLHGRKVRVVVLNRDHSENQTNPWIKSLRAWADSHRPIGHVVDDSRESIYTGTLDDAR